MLSCLLNHQLRVAGLNGKETQCLMTKVAQHSKIRNDLSSVVLGRRADWCGNYDPGSVTKCPPRHTDETLYSLFLFGTPHAKHICVTKGLRERMDIFPAANACERTNLQGTSTSFAGAARIEFQNLLHSWMKKSITAEKSLQSSMNFVGDL